MRIQYKQVSTELELRQICAKKPYREQGVFTGLYAQLKASICADFPYFINEIDLQNTRSIRTHQKIGFEHIKAYRTDEGREWLLVLLDLNK